MHLGSLPGLLLALAWGLLGGSSAHTAGTSGIQARLSDAALYSIVAQAATPTVTTGTTSITPTATLVVTSTETLSATATLTSGAVLSTTQTIVPIPTTVPQSASPNLRWNPLDWNFLTSAPVSPTPALGPFAWIFLILLLALIAAAVYGYRVLRPRWKNTNTVLYKAVARFGQPALWIGIIGILLILARVVSLDFFNKRIWLYLVGIAFLGLLGWIYYWYRNSYPQEIAKFQKTLKAKQYQPGKGPVRSTSGPSAPVAPPRGSKSRRKK